MSEIIGLSSNRRIKMLIIGLTGGIGSGKSTATSHLEKKNYKIIDADKIARQITQKGEPTLQELKDAFGDEIIDKKTGELKRKMLAEMAFSDSKKEKLLNEITHKAIISKIEEDINRYKKSGEKIIFLEAPLLFETGVDKYCDLVWLIVAEHEKKVERILAREKISRTDVINRINCQMKDDEKLPLADEVLDNSNERESLLKQIDELIKKYEG